jgi:hypothetical protein
MEKLKIKNYHKIDEVSNGILNIKKVGINYLITKREWGKSEEKIVLRVTSFINKNTNEIEYELYHLKKHASVWIKIDDIKDL